MGKTLANLRDALAGALGFDQFSDLTARDQADVDTIINAAYFECYASRDGRLPRWATQYGAKIVKAPAAATLGLTNGSTAVTGVTFEADYVGSFVRIGDGFYRIASTTALVQPWTGTTGNHAATIYFNAVAIGGQFVKFLETPSIVGVGPLVPLPTSEAEVLMRSTPSFDFEPKLTRGPFAYARQRFDPSLITDVGDPRYFHVDQAAVSATFATGSRLHLYPLPGAVFTVEFRAQVLPLALTGPTQEPVLPHDEVDVAGAILEPLMFGRLLKHPLGRRYSGNNGSVILQAAEEARAQLNTFRSVQFSGPKAMRVAGGW